MSEQVKKILIVDDEEFNLDILNEYLKDAGYDTVLATNGLEAVAKLESTPDVDAIVLDRMMPVMDGMQFMNTLNGLEKYKNTPVIMQTAAGTSQQIMEGILAGVFYYLTKPYEKSTLLAILNSAIEQQITETVVNDEAQSYRKVMKLLVEGTFRFTTLEDIKELAFVVSRALPESDKVLFGLNEIMVNAVEHGNLGITCEEKKNLLANATWQQEVTKLLNMPKNANKHATLTLSITATHFEITIKDMGDGFNYEKYLKFDPARLTDPNGRGIAMAKMYSFSDIKYNDKGNEVTLKVKRR